MLSFGTSISLNNLLALKSFHTFLFNYQLHEKPSFFEKLIIPYFRAWIEKKALFTIRELKRDNDAKMASVSLNDVSAGIFTCLYLIQNPSYLLGIIDGKQLFMLMAQMELDFVKIQKPKTDTEYKNV